MNRKLTILVALVLIIGSISIINSTKINIDSNKVISENKIDEEEKNDEEPESQLQRKLPYRNPREGWKVKDIEKATKELEKEEINKGHISREKNSQIIGKKYVGEVLDKVDYIGEAKVYSEKNSDSEVIHTLKDYDKVRLLETLPYGWFKVELEDGRVGYVDATYIRAKEIPPHNYDENSKEWVIIFSNDSQEVNIYHNGKLVKKSIASGGIWDTFTPKGVFQVESGRRGEWFFSERYEQGGKYWVGFKDSYLFHSIPCYRDQTIIEEEATKLGEPSSHGCIRLPVDIAKYIYDHIPDGSLVIIE